MLLQYTADAIQFVTAIVAFFYFKNYQDSFLKYIFFYFWYNAVNLSLAYYTDNILEVDNGYLFNIYQAVLYILIYWILKNVIKSKIRLKIVNVLFLIYIVVQIFEVIYISNNLVTDYLVLSYFTGGIIAILSIMYYGIELLQSQNITSLRSNLTVWFFMGNLIFWIGYLPISITYEYYEHLNEDLVKDLEIVQNIFIILQNSIFIIGFLKSTKRYAI